MSRLTLRLPDCLHQQLEDLAAQEETSLNQYIVYELTQQVTLAYRVQTTPEKAIAEQRAAYNALLQNLGQASFDEISRAMDERETVSPEDGLTEDVIQAIRQRIAGQLAR
jgi:hypothetical protein